MDWLKQAPSRLGLFFSFVFINLTFFLEKCHNLLKSQYFHEKRVYDLTKRVHRLLNISSEGPWARAHGTGPGPGPMVPGASELDGPQGPKGPMDLYSLYIPCILLTRGDWDVHPNCNLQAWCNGVHVEVVAKQVEVSEFAVDPVRKGLLNFMHSQTILFFTCLNIAAARAVDREFTRDI